MIFYSQKGIIRENSCIEKMQELADLYKKSSFPLSGASEFPMATCEIAMAKLSKDFAMGRFSRIICLYIQDNIMKKMCQECKRTLLIRKSCGSIKIFYGLVNCFVARIICGAWNYEIREIIKLC